MRQNIDTERDSLILVSDLIEQRLGRRLSPATTWRWIYRGVSVGGRRVRLEAVRSSGRWYSTTRALSAFLAAQTDAALADTADDDTPTERPAATSRALETAGLI